jgi:ABC-type cobalamin/Fe3+-siderophores transport system ATPase subunit
MKAANLITLVLIIVGGLNWGLVGVFDWNLVAAIFGDGKFLVLLGPSGCGKSTCCGSSRGWRT